MLPVIDPHAAKQALRAFVFMAIEKLIISVSSPDRPGIIQQLSQAVLAHGGNWAESSFSILANVFVGIVSIDIDEKHTDELMDHLRLLSEHGIQVHIASQSTRTEPASEPESTVIMQLEANDREGIIEEITSQLAHNGVNIINLESWCESASMAGYDLFFAEIEASLPAGFSNEDLQRALEKLSDDMVVEIQSD